MELVKRVEGLASAGWEVKPTKNGYRVKTPAGIVKVIHMTYSDRNAIEAVTRALDALGLTDAEQELARQSSEIKAVKKAAMVAKTAAQFSEAEKAVEEENKRTAMLAKAAGPYVTPEKVHINWFAQPHPSPWMKWVIMTPEIARYLLLEHNDINRPLAPRRREHYKRIILRKEWHLTHQGMAMDADGKLQDGQHRLSALVAAADETGDESLYIVAPFFVGMNPNNFLAIDEGGNRSPQDLFARGGESYGSAIATTVRLVIAFDDQSPKRAIRERQTNETIVNWFGSDPEEFREAARFGVAWSRKAKITPGPLSAAHYILRRANGLDNRYVDRFLLGLATGLKYHSRTLLDDDDQRRVTRQFFKNARENNRRVGGLESVAIVVLAWNNIVEGRSPRFVKFTDDSNIPRVTILKDSGDDTAIYTAPSAFEGEMEE
jgi:hypothetical protein